MMLAVTNSRVFLKENAIIRKPEAIAALLDDLETAHYVKTSGQDGLHVMVPLGAQLEHGDARTLGEVLARVVAAELPEIAIRSPSRAVA